MNPAPSPRAAHDDYAFLIGRTSLKEYLSFMSAEPADARTADPAALADEWRAAHDRLADLQYIEAGWADGARPAPLPAGLQPLAAEVAADPIFGKAFAAIPSRLAMVELDRLVVFQKTVNLSHVRRVRDRLGPDPTPEQVFRLCLPFDHPTPDWRVGRPGADEVVFVSDSNDLRILESVVLAADEVGYRSIGPVVGVVGLAVGYGSNYLNAISCAGRLVLNNGTHRACALRELGVSHVPCVVQTVLRPDELSAAVGGAFRRNPDHYLKSPRPPVLKDYFDPGLRTLVRIVPRARHVRVRFTVEEVDLPVSGGHPDAPPRRDPR